MTAKNQEQDSIEKIRHDCKASSTGFGKAVVLKLIDEIDRLQKENAKLKENNSKLIEYFTGQIEGMKSLEEGSHQSDFSDESKLGYLETKFPVKDLKIDELNIMFEEQCRLNGMGQERELKLIAGIDRLRAQLIAREAHINELQKAGWKLAFAWLRNPEPRSLHQLRIDMDEAFHFACQVGLITNESKIRGEG